MVFRPHFPTRTAAFEYHCKQNKIPFPVAALAMIRNAEGQFELDWEKVTQLLAAVPYQVKGTNDWMDLAFETQDE